MVATGQLAVNLGPPLGVTAVTGKLTSGRSRPGCGATPRSVSSSTGSTPTTPACPRHVARDSPVSTSTRAGADLEHAFVALQPEGLDHEGDDVRLRDRLLLLDRERSVLVGELAQVGRHVALPANAAHRREHLRRAHAARRDLVRDHPPPHAVVVDAGIHDPDQIVGAAGPRYAHLRRAEAQGARVGRGSSRFEWHLPNTRMVTGKDPPGGRGESRVGAPARDSAGIHRRGIGYGSDPAASPDRIARSMPRLGRTSRSVSSRARFAAAGSLGVERVSSGSSGPSRIVPSSSPSGARAGRRGSSRPRPSDQDGSPPPTTCRSG